MSRFHPFDRSGTLRAPDNNSQRMLRLFIGSDVAHGRHEPVTAGAGKVEIKSHARTVAGPATEDDWGAHLAGAAPLGVIPIRADGTCFWGCIDIDDYTVNHAQLVVQCEQKDFPLLVCRSKSGGAHLFLFSSGPVHAAKMRSRLAAIASQLGVEGSEIFPKQTTGASTGNWLNMPYLGDQRVAIKRTGSAMTLSEFLRVAEAQRVPLEFFEAQGSHARDDLEGAPKCLAKVVAGGIGEGARNDTLFALGVHARKRFGREWKSKIDEWNHIYMRPPLPHDEVGNIVRSLEKRGYGYRRDNRPICERCETTECPMRSNGSHIAFEQVTIVRGGDETVWNVTLGGQVIALPSDEVFDQTTFNKRCLARLGRCFHRMKNDEWVDLLNEAAARASILEAPPSASPHEQFRELMEEFCLNRHRGYTREDILTGRPWEDEDAGRHYFRLRDLRRFLDQMRALRGESSVALGERIRSLGGDSTEIRIKGKPKHVFWVPTNVLSAPPSVELPPLERDPI
jgi:hypothetical protein